MEVFRKSIFRTECDECRKPFPVNTGGVCENCKRILCDRHLHGSFFRRMAIALGSPNRCVACRAGRGPATA
jgi:hypothetical protein